ncbi:hypothetical protein MAR_016358 [Mya arenaria]|uniref:Uncharacterized protein n=1 Tax=Mya arenaria TaxID=6604 RepID=A0ABY7FNE4_MYAAR|nr:hypothetical protein MAR_016358 [Mya arenaria]
MCAKHKHGASSSQQVPASKPSAPYPNRPKTAFNREFLCDKTLPMGLSHSCFFFEQFSIALKWIATSNFLQSASDIVVPIKVEKTYLPDTTMTFVGIELDSPWLKGCPLKKLKKYELQSLIGLLNFACASRTRFLRRMIDLTM